MILGMPAKTFITVTGEPWIASAINSSSPRIVTVARNAIGWDTAPTYEVTGSSGAVGLLIAAPGLVLMRAGGVNRYSNDNGQTWAVATGLSTTIAYGRLVLFGGNYYLGSNGVWRSTDNGASWTQVTTSGGYQPIEFAGAIFSGDTNNFNTSRSTDGVTWTKVGVFSAFYSAKTANRIMFGPSTAGTVIRTSTTGLSGSFNTVSVSASASFRGIAGDPLGSSALIIDAAGNYYYSVDHGQNWTSGGKVGGANDVAASAQFAPCEYANGFWVVWTIDSSTQNNRIWRAEAPSGPWTQVAEYPTAGGASIAGVRYIGA